MFHYQLRDQLPVTLPKKLTLDKEILNLRQAVDWLKISLVRSVALKRSEKPILWTLSSTARGTLLDIHRCKKYL
ncbi:GSCOCG00011918001-RA-CDS [Cotesia congregata]|nr:GSCOCG00011918001-RA-CDS [Cotesia congregata]